MADRIIFHVDANSAFLSWTAAYKVKVLGETQDIREIPSVVAGDKASRHSIILAKSTPAKKHGIPHVRYTVFFIVFLIFYVKLPSPDRSTGSPTS